MDRLADEYDLLILDLDGVVYLGEQPVAGAVPALAEVARRGPAAAYATNNASRLRSDVAGLLHRLGVAATTDQVVTSAAVTAGMLAERLSPGTPVLVVGAEALRAELAAVGLTPVSSAADKPQAVVQGYAAQVGWVHLAEASIAVRGGAWWVATNADLTLPTERGPLPGNGALVAALSAALGRGPDLVVGKPEPALFQAAAAAAGAARPLVVGDRLDTDIAGAVRAGMDSLVVLTGVCRPADLLMATPAQRPTYVAADLGALAAPAAGVRVPLGVVEWQGWWVVPDEGGSRLGGGGEAVDALRLLCAYHWSAGTTGPVRPGSAEAQAALRALELAG